MALNIKDPEADRLARALAAATGESITVAARAAFAERLARVQARDTAPEVLAELESIIARARERETLDDRTAPPHWSRPRSSPRHARAVLPRKTSRPCCGKRVSASFHSMPRRRRSRRPRGAASARGATPPHSTWAAATPTRSPGTWAPRFSSRATTSGRPISPRSSDRTRSRLAGSSSERSETKRPVAHLPADLPGQNGATTSSAGS